MEPRFMDATQCAKATSPYEQAAGEWHRSKERLEMATHNHQAAGKALDEARTFEQQSWAALENVAGRAVPCPPPGGYVNAGSGYQNR